MGIRGHRFPRRRASGHLTRIIYLPESDTMILAQGHRGKLDWTAIQSRIEVYHGWSAGNISRPDPVITSRAPTASR